jgi:hypothetical protein
MAHPFGMRGGRKGRRRPSLSSAPFPSAQPLARVAPIPSCLFYQRDKTQGISGCPGWTGAGKELESSSSSLGLSMDSSFRPLHLSLLSCKTLAEPSRAISGRFGPVRAILGRAELGRAGSVRVSECAGPIQHLPEYSLRRFHPDYWALPAPYIYIYI